MKVLKQSAQRLQLRLGLRGISTGICTLDRERNVADIAQFALAIPYHFKRVALSEIKGVGVKRKGLRKIYNPILELRSGRGVSIGGYTKEDAVEAARAIRDFLKMSR